MALYGIDFLIEEKQKDKLECSNKMLDAEGIRLTGGAIGLISRLADGSVRDSLSILERCLADNAEVIDEDTVLRCMGTAAGDSLAVLANAVAAYDAAGALTGLDTFYQNGRDLRSVFDAFCTLLRDILIVKTLPRGWESFVSPGADANTLTDLSGKFSAARLTDVIHTIGDAMNRMQRSGSNRTEAELALIAVCTPAVSAPAASDGASAAGVGNEELLARLAMLEQKIAAGIPAAPAAEQKPKAVPKAEAPKKAAPPKEAAAAPTGALLAPNQVKALLDRLKPSLSRSAHVTLSMAALSVHNGKLRVIVEDDLSSRVLNDHNVRNMLTDAAAAVLGTTAPAEVLTEGAADTSNDAGSGFDLLAELGRASGIDVNIR